MFAMTALTWLISGLAVFVALASALDMILEARDRSRRIRPRVRVTGFRR